MYLIIILLICDSINPKCVLLKVLFTNLISIQPSIFIYVINGMNSMTQHPLAQDSMTNGFYTYRLYALNSPRNQKTQLTRDVYIFEETVTYFSQYLKNYAKNLKYESTNRWSLSLELKKPGPWSSHRYLYIFVQLYFQSLLVHNIFSR